MLPTPPASPQLTGLSAPEDRLGKVLAGRLRFTSILGIGAYGVVYTAVDLQTDITYAVKALNKIGLEPRQRKFQQREIQLHHQASAHPNVVSMIQIIDCPECTFVVLEYCPEGDLFANITERGNYTGNDALAKSVFLQILDAVEYCHSIGIYHRDLKPENILVTDHELTAKLADFGLATSDPITSDFGCGSTFYMSPECQQSSPKGYQCYATAPNDVWSLGVILVNLTCGRNPWKRASVEDSTFKAFLKDPRFLRSILPLSPELDDILRRIFECNPAQRISIPELKTLIRQCPRFTTKSARTPTPVHIPAPLPSPPFSPVDYERDAAFRAGFASEYSYDAQLPASMIPVQPLSLPQQELTGHFSPLASSLPSCCSDVCSAFTASGPVSPASSTSSFTQISSVPQKVLPPVQSSYVSASSNNWLNPFLIHAANFAKQMYHQPSFLAPVRVY